MTVCTTRPLRYTMWTTKTYNTIPINSMTDEHLLSSYLLCVKNNWRTEFIPALFEELEARGYKESHPELFI